MAFTKSDLDQCIDVINATLERHGKGDRKIIAQSRGGYVGLDLYENGKCLRTLAIGKPKELRAEAFEWAFGRMID